MAIPLYSSTSREQLVSQSSANIGLVFDKYFGGWNPEYNDLVDKTTKSGWVKSIVAAARPEGNAVEAFSTRQRNMVQALGGFTLRVVTTSRFVTGTGIANPLENGFVFHPTLGVPYLPASGLKGALKAYWTQWAQSKGDERTDRLFGLNAAAGSAIFFDMLPVSIVKLVPEVMTPHYGPWYEKGAAAPPGDWHSPTPIPFVAIDEGNTFEISIAPRNRALSGIEPWASDAKQIETHLLETLQFIGLGAKTAVGYGRFAPAPAAAGKS